MPPREKGAKACLQDWAGHFLRSALRERFAQLRPIRAISQESRAVFSARQTVWRSRQSGANLSLTKFPANREFNREISKNRASKTALLLSNPHISPGETLLRRKTEQGIFRSRTGIYQRLTGIYKIGSGIH